MLALCRRAAAPSRLAATASGRRGAAGCAARALSGAAARPDVTLYQYEMCPFCCKVKAFLDYAGVPYRTVEVNPLTKAELKALGGDYRKVPVATVGGERVNDSAAILDRLVDDEAARDPGFAARRGEFADAAGVRDALEWADKRLAVLLFPNICRSLSESLQAFRYVMDAPNFTPGERWANYLLGGLAMSIAQGKIKKKYGIEDERAAIFAALAEWEGRLGGRRFHGGDAPDLGDLAVFGVLRSIDHTDTYRELLEKGPPAVTQEWFPRVAEAVGESSRFSRMPAGAEPRK